MVAMMVAGVTMLLMAGGWYPGWTSAAVWGFGLTGSYALYVLLTRDAVVGAILGFALVAGFVELLSDWYLVTVTQTLTYPKDGILLWKSPLYMPFSWTVVLTQLGFIGYLISRRLPAIQTALLLVLVSGMLIPLYEKWAIQSGWWDYVGTPKWLGVPYYIFLAEAILVFPVPFFVNKAIGGGWQWMLTGGMLEGVLMLVSCLIAFNLVG